MTEKENHILKEQSIKWKKDEKMAFNDSVLKTILKVKKKAFIVIIVVCFIIGIVVNIVVGKVVGSLLGVVEGINSGIVDGSERLTHSLVVSFK